MSANGNSGFRIRFKTASSCLEIVFEQSAMSPFAFDWSNHVFAIILRLTQYDTEFSNTVHFRQIKLKTIKLSLNIAALLKINKI